MGSMSHSSTGLSTTTVFSLSLHCTGPCVGTGALEDQGQPTSLMQQPLGAHISLGTFWQDVSGVYFFTCCFSRLHTSLGHWRGVTIIILLLLLTLSHLSTVL